MTLSIVTIIVSVEFSTLGIEFIFVQPVIQNTFSRLLVLFHFNMTYKRHTFFPPSLVLSVCVCGLFLQRCRRRPLTDGRLSGPPITQTASMSSWLLLADADDFTMPSSQQKLYLCRLLPRQANPDPGFLARLCCLKNALRLGTLL